MSFEPQEEEGEGASDGAYRKAKGPLAARHR